MQPLFLDCKPCGKRTRFTVNPCVCGECGWGYDGEELYCDCESLSLHIPAHHNYTVFGGCFCGSGNLYPITCAHCWPSLYRETMVSHGYAFDYGAQYKIVDTGLVGWIGGSPQMREWTR